MAARIHQVELPDVTLSVTSAGKPGDPLVVLLHGFPEIGYSWRHQIPVLADAGYRVIAPDQRGYGWSDQPDALEGYDITRLVQDVAALIKAEGASQATIVGHDWGAMVAPWVALFHPELVNGVALLSVPFQMRGDKSPITRLREEERGPFSYILDFQEPGAEDLLDADPISVLRGAFWLGRTPPGEAPSELPPFLNPGEFENYCRAFSRSGFGPPLNWYRNMHRNWELTEQFTDQPLTCPSLFIGGRDDFVVAADGELREAVTNLPMACTDLRGQVIIDDAGHWVQQEAPAEVNAALLDFLTQL